MKYKYIFLATRSNPKPHNDMWFIEQFRRLEREHKIKHRTISYNKCCNAILLTADKELPREFLTEIKIYFSQILFFNDKWNFL